MVKKSESHNGVEVLFGTLARVTIQVEMKKRDLGYRELTQILNEKFEVGENERNLRNKIARGTFSAGFFLMCMKALDCTTIRPSFDDMRAAHEFEISQTPEDK